MNLGVDDTTLEHAANAACRAALRAGLSDVDARDLAQDALVRALTSAQPPVGVPLPAWVYGIAKNLGRDHAKSAKRREVPIEVAPEADNDADLTTVLAVRSAVEELPEALRDVITLHELEENSLRETAEALQIPFDTAKDRLRRAREQLRARLADDTALGNERTHTRRRAAAYGGAIVAGLYALLGQRGSAIAATGSIAAVAAGTAARTVPLWLTIVVGGALLAGGFVAGRATAPEPRETPAPVVASQIEEPAAVDVAVVSHDDPPAAAPTVERPAAPPSRATAPAPVPPPPAAEPVRANDEEQLLLDRARTGLRRGMHDEALVTLMEHERRFATGDLVEERDVLVIEAYLRSGKLTLARKRVDRYRAQHPDGVLRGRVDTFAGELP